MQSFILEIILLIGLVGLNGLFSMAELAVVSSRKARIDALIADGDRRALTLKELVDSPENLFSTVQIGITLIGIVAGVFGGATFSEYIANWLLKIPGTDSFAYPLAYSIVVVSITILSIIFGELIPKRLAMANPERFALILARPLKALSKLLSPLIKFLNFSSNSVINFAGGLGKARPSVTEDELLNILDESTKAGVVEHEERPILERVLSLGDRRLDSIMTHRRDVIWLNTDATLQDSLNIIKESRHTWYPVCEGSIDAVKGILCAKDLWTATVPTSILEFVKPAYFLPGSTIVLKALDQFKNTQNHIALIVDEHGNFEGLITHHDLSSVVLGSLPYRGEEQEEDSIITREDGSWLVDGALSVHDFSEHFDCSLTDDSDEHDFQTVAGFVISKLGKIPSSADHFDWNNFRFEVMDMDGNRVDKILLSKIS